MSKAEKLTDAEIMQRFIKAIDSNPSRLAIKLGYKSNATIKHVVDGRNGISVKMANKIIDNYPKVNFLYLTRGKEPMFLDEKKEQNQTNMFYEDMDVIQILKDIRSLLRENNYLLQKNLKENE